MAEVWILGGTGRSGRAIATALRARGIRPTLVGRDGARLTAVAEGDRTVVAASIAAMAGEISRQRPAVVVNTVGPFATTAEPIIRACLPASHYVDLANDLSAFTTTLGLHDAIAAAGRTAVTGAGFGVAATESVVVKLCEGRPAPRRVRVDAVASLAMEAGAFGEALAASILDGIPGVAGGGRFQGRRYRGGRLVPDRIGGDARQLTLPDGGGTATAASIPLGELMAAQRASGAPDVQAASSEAPSSPVARAAMAALLPVLAIGPVREFAKRRLAAVQVTARPRPRQHSWGHAVIDWPDGTTREGWLRLGDAQEWTGIVPAEVCRRLLAGEGRPGAFTPAALFGAELAESCGAEYLLVADR
ncbi:hypothetical protein [Actinoplanes palleronii]|uniref:Membrane protein n=1 Tax=Actinoplanes palleronii TaxID=113570 RepID=A0ABQ4BPD6_9ACTN|nr:hypothetical protein [Actinoplanes palleronii]GIE72541.1 membrane protein [Actinoplanes palleronii]